MDIVTFNQLTKHAKLHKLNPIRLISPTVTEEQQNQANKIPTWNVVRHRCRGLCCGTVTGAQKTGIWNQTNTIP